MSIAMLRLRPAANVGRPISFGLSARKAVDPNGGTDPQGLQLFLTAIDSISGTAVPGLTAYLTVYNGAAVSGPPPPGDNYTLGPTASPGGSARACPIATYPYNLLVQVTITGFDIPDGYSMTTDPPISINVTNIAKDGIAPFCL